MMPQRREVIQNLCLRFVKFHGEVSFAVVSEKNSGQGRYAASEVDRVVVVPPPIDLHWSFWGLVARDYLACRRSIDRFFLSNDGCSLQGEAISQIVSRFTVSRTGGIKLSATDFRHLRWTYVNDYLEKSDKSESEKYDIRNQLAASVGHTLETAERTYVYRSYAERSRLSGIVTEATNNFLCLPGATATPVHSRNPM